MTTLYEQDYYQWIQEQAALLKTGQCAGLDVAHLVEEVLSLGKSEQRALFSHLVRLLTHLLKLQGTFAQQPGVYERNRRGWMTTCHTQYTLLTMVLEDSPSLRPRLGRDFARAYTLAQRHAATALGVSRQALDFPWMAEQLLDPEQWPRATRDDEPG